jgi:diguanylate cyclase (GGDEF)-like protein/PAS domain S-box-containing protein
MADIAALEASERRSRVGFDSAPVPMAEIDLEGRYLKVNAALCEAFGYRSDQLVGVSVRSICHPDDNQPIGERIEAMVAGKIDRVRVERRFMHANGDAIWVAVSVAPVFGKGGRISHMLTHYLDITDRKRFEHHLADLVDHDPLTGLLNRRGFDAELDDQTSHVSRYGPAGALLVIDLDHFKEVNDALGHNAGDELLAAVADLLRATLRQTDKLARIGGDEFAIILPHAGRDDAEAIAAMIVSAVRDHAKSFIDVQAQLVTASVGIALFDPQFSGQDVLIQADRSMYEAKKAGRDQYS